MARHVAVSPIEHRSLRILEERSEAMGDGAMCCVTFPDEFRNLQAHYPILFKLNQERSEFLCLAMFGFQTGENLFLKGGAWDARYVPLAMDIQPFMIGLPQGEDEDRKVVLDLDSPRVNEGEGRRLFDEFGMPTAYLESVSRKLDYLDGGFSRSQDFIAVLRKYELLEPLTIDITLKDGSQNKLIGFHAIHEEKLSSLDAAALHDIHAQGYLQPIYMALASMSNLVDLIERKEALAGHGA